jgi:hypothetical protein
MTDQIYGIIPETGGVSKQAITLGNYSAAQIGAALARLRKSGRLVEQNGVWFRAPPEALEKAA